MNIQTINTIEISSICDNSCQYCPAKDQHKYRDTGYMDFEIFKKAIAQVKRFAIAGTQRELNLFGIGEPTLHPDLVKFVRYARENLPFRQVLHLNTNGNLMTEDLARRLKHAGITEIDVTVHKLKPAANAIRILRKVGIHGHVSIDAVTMPNNWAGQVDWFEPEYDAGICPWLEKGQVMVMSDGRITQCCIDAFAKGVFATIDDDLSNYNTRTFELCSKCHHKLPLTNHAGGIIHAVGYQR